ncbi:hypothetical protein Rsub_05683 [Raphidocelis subcapitata]|uniref:Putative auto-transporter adhesin head GIN domain-containing protein n=1 Tax=Raphidocelis subcapitata TaxID=307507 RepID=A0A2V0P2F2_9CHLO|nr:hypothetical protein Rsub_05683 [Raphidocelis subcapitata]|eukprot:GBF93072.1 hypothetical protein Rsub_05683 [Raphidocelis subcapitata]
MRPLPGRLAILAAVLLSQLLLPGAAGQQPAAPAPAPAAAAPAVQPAVQPSPQASPAPAGGARVSQLPAFDGVVSCAPFTILIEPAGGTIQPPAVAAGAAPNASSVLLEAEPDASDAVSLQVAGTTLYVSVSGDFETRAPLKLTARIPADRLRRAAARGGGTVIVGPGFALPAGAPPLRLSASGPGALIVRNVSAPAADIRAEGTADVFVAGRIGTANVTGSGTGVVVLDGAAGAVDVSLDGISKAYVNPVNGDVNITGSVTGLSKLLATGGRCEIDGPSFSIDVPFFSADFGGPRPCLAISEDALPSARARWTCGLRVRARGEQQCAPAGAASTQPAPAPPAPAPAPATAATTPATAPTGTAAPAPVAAAPTPAAAPAAAAPAPVTAAPPPAAAGRRMLNHRGSAGSDNDSDSDSDGGDDSGNDDDGLWWPFGTWVHTDDSAAYAASVSGGGQDEEEGGGFSYRATSLRCEGAQQGADLEVAP